MTDHTEMQIPDDVMEAAEAIWEETWENYQGDHESDPIGVIARAILAERERCARIAEAAMYGSTASHRIRGGKA